MPKPAAAAQAPFARLLQQSRSAQSAPVATEPAASARADAPAESDTPAAPNAPVKARAKSVDKPVSARPAEVGKQAGAKALDANDAAENEAPRETAEAGHANGPAPGPVDAALTPWLSAHPHPPADADRGAAQAGADEASAADAQAAALPGAAASAHAKRTPADARTGRDEAAARQASPSPGPASSIALEAASAQQRPDVNPTSNVRSVDTTPDAAALRAAAFDPLLGSTRQSAEARVVHLPTPLASPDFAQALGVQMSVLASDGVQRAELQLNPSEMGPVSVQIVIDGTHAHVDFGADLAATRQAIEAGLPELAGALRDAGFTLSGGGVSQHSGSRSGAHEAAGHDARQRHADGSVASTGDGSDVGAAAIAARQRRTVALGGVDLYA